VTVVDGTTPKIHDGWMWDLTVPGNNDHDFYIAVATAAVLVHNCTATKRRRGERRTVVGSPRGGTAAAWGKRSTICDANSEREVW